MSIILLHFMTKHLFLGVNRVGNSCNLKRRAVVWCGVISGCLTLEKGFQDPGSRNWEVKGYSLIIVNTFMDKDGFYPLMYKSTPLLWSV